jgi:hypothetical protein
MMKKSGVNLKDIGRNVGKGNGKMIADHSPFSSHSCFTFPSAMRDK